MLVAKSLVSFIEQSLKHIVRIFCEILVLFNLFCQKKRTLFLTNAGLKSFLY